MPYVLGKVYRIPMRVIHANGKPRNRQVPVFDCPVLGKEQEWSPEAYKLSQQLCRLAREEEQAIAFLNGMKGIAAWITYMIEKEAEDEMVQD